MVDEVTPSTIKDRHTGNPAGSWAELIRLVKIQRHFDNGVSNFNLLEGGIPVRSRPIGGYHHY